MHSHCHLFLGTLEVVIYPWEVVLLGHASGGCRPLQPFYKCQLVEESAWGQDICDLPFLSIMEQKKLGPGLTEIQVEGVTLPPL